MGENGSVALSLDTVRVSSGAQPTVLESFLPSAVFGPSTGTCFTVFLVFF